jgi:AraC-like DNA-binding protein
MRDNMRTIKGRYSSGLTTREPKLAEISSKLGFEDPSYFNKFFKKIVKVTPADFREKY